MTTRPIEAAPAGLVVLGVQVCMAGSPWVEYVLPEPMIVQAGSSFEVVGLGEEWITVRLSGHDHTLPLRPAGGQGAAGE